LRCQHAPLVTGSSCNVRKGLACGDRLSGRRHVVTWLAIGWLLVLGGLRRATAAPCTADDLCGPGSDPCLLAASHECDSPLVLDLAGRAFEIAQDKALRITHGDGEGTLMLTGVASVTLRKSALMKAQGDSGNSGLVVIVSAGPVSLASGSTVDVSASLDGGYLEIESQSGLLEASGLLKATAGQDGEGGEVVLTARDGGVTIGGNGINASASGEFSGGGSVQVSATGDVSLLGPVDVRGGDSGELSAEAGGSILVGVKGDVDGQVSAAGSVGASISLLAHGDVQLAGKITATAPGNADDGGGLGGDVSIMADTGSVELAAPMDLRGSGPDGQGGIVEAMAGLDLTVTGLLQAGVDGGGFGGSIALSAAGRATIASTLDVRADDGGGAIEVVSDDALTVTGRLRAETTGGGEGGEIALRACTLLLTRDAMLSATGSGLFPSASTLLQASGQMTVSGILESGDRNVLEYREALPMVGSGATITPKEEIIPNPDLPCCTDACTPDTTTTTSTTTTSTTTTSTTATTAPMSTTTTSTTATTAPTATTTSTSPAGPVSTTTAPAATSTTTAPTTTSQSGSTSTTSTTPPTTDVGPPATQPTQSCLDRPPPGFDGVDCYLDALSETVSMQSPDALGGRKSARNLARRIERVQRLVQVARRKRHPLPTLRRAKRQLRSFRARASRGQRRQRIARQLGDRLVALAGEASATIERLQSSLRVTSRP
jgi:hypothetical protein